jgi:hypothetical protein
MNGRALARTNWQAQYYESAAGGTPAGGGPLAAVRPVKNLDDQRCRNAQGEAKLVNGASKGRLIWLYIAGFLAARC